ncbi:MAG: VCBS domain-containing protein [Kordiimonas sp.]
MTIEAQNSINHGFTETAELLVVGPNVQDLDILLTGLARPMDILRLTHDSNPLEQIATALKGREETSTLHLLAHGEPGAIHLGGAPLDFAALYKNEDAVNEIREALAGKAAVALWACSVGWMNAGERFINALEEKLGATVFASDRPVGAESLGGDWRIGTASPFMKSTEAAYPHTLGTFDITGGAFRSGDSSIYEETDSSSGTAITMTATLNGTANWLGAGVINQGGSVGEALYYQGSQATSVTVSFSHAVDISSFNYARLNTPYTGNLTYTVTKGTGTTVVEDISTFGRSGGWPTKTISPTDWTGVTEFTITNSNGNVQPVLDTLVYTYTPNAAPEFDDADDALAFTVAEDSSATTFTGLEVTDSDSGDTLTWSVSSAASKGTVTLPSPATFTATGGAGDKPTGDFTYTPTADAEGTDNFTIQVSDGKGGTDSIAVTVTITPSADASVIGGTTTGSVTEGNVGDAAVTATGALTITDVDVGDNPSFADVASTAGGNGYGSFELSSGTWTYTLDQSKVQNLAAGASVTDSTTFTASDSNTQVVTVTINGSNDAAVIGGVLTGSVGEDSSGTITGTATSTDVDGTDNSFTAANNLAGTYGTLSMAANGVWTYDVNEASTAVQAAAANATLTDTIAVSAADGTAANVVVTINGANDAPTITLPSTPTIALGASNVAIDDALQVADADGDNVTVTLTADWSDTLSLNTTGLTFSSGDGTDDNSMQFSGSLSDVNTALDSLTISQVSNGETTGGIAVSVNDGNGGTASQKLNITVVDGDKPTGATVTYSGTEDTPVTLDTVGMAASREFDAVDTVNYITITGVTGGTLALGAGAATTAKDSTTATAAVGNITSGALINPDDIGKLTFTPTANSTTAGTITYTVTDTGPDTSPAATLTVNLAAQNDAPTAADSTVTLNEDTSYTFKAADFNFSDVDSGDTLSQVNISTVNLAAGDTLKLSNVDVTGKQTIAVADIPNLVYTPAANANGAARSTFDFSVQDGTTGSATDYTLTLNVTDVAEPVVVVTPTPEPEPEPVVIRADQDADNSNDTLTGASLNDTIEAGGGDDTVSGGDGADSLDGGVGKDTLDGGNDDDIIRGGEGDDSIEGATGDDKLFGGADSDTIQAGDGGDIIWAGAQEGAGGMVTGDAGNDRMGAGGGDDTLDGGAGNDVIYGGSGADSVLGGEGTDQLFGGTGSDDVIGGAGDDVIWGGAGDDSLTGGEGADTFSFITGFGSDTINDFEVSGSSVDKLDLSQIDGLTLADLQATATFEGGDAQLSIGSHGTIILAGIDEAELQAMFDAGQVLVA